MFERIFERSEDICAVNYLSNSQWLHNSPTSPVKEEAGIVRFIADKVFEEANYCNNRGTGSSSR